SESAAVQRSSESETWLDLYVVIAFRWGNDYKCISDKRGTSIAHHQLSLLKVIHPAFVSRKEKVCGGSSLDLPCQRRRRTKGCSDLSEAFLLIKLDHFFHRVRCANRGVKCEILSVSRQTDQC